MDRDPVCQTLYQKGIVNKSNTSVDVNMFSCLHPRGRQQLCGGQGRQNWTIPTATAEGQEELEDLFIFWEGKKHKNHKLFQSGH